MGDAFFCEAEDGIRDGTVTGVQTCALPISVAATLSMIVIFVHKNTIIESVAATDPLIEKLARIQMDLGQRSEERRVGKEWSPECHLQGVTQTTEHAAAHESKGYAGRRERSG